MDPQDLASQISGVAALNDPVRRDLYFYVAAEPAPVSRDQASAAVGVPRHTAKFHLDRLVQEGLLDTNFKRLGGRDGPGAGRPTKRYRRSARQVTVALPERRYDLGTEWGSLFPVGDRIPDLLVDPTLADNRAAHPDLMADVLARRYGISAQPAYQEGDPAKIAACRAVH